MLHFHDIHELLIMQCSIFMTLVSTHQTNNTQPPLVITNMNVPTSTKHHRCQCKSVTSIGRSLSECTLPRGCTGSMSMNNASEHVRAMHNIPINVLNSLINSCPNFGLICSCFLHQSTQCNSKQVQNNLYTLCKKQLQMAQSLDIANIITW